MSAFRDRYWEADRARIKTFRLIQQYLTIGGKYVERGDKSTVPDKDARMYLLLHTLQKAEVFYWSKPICEMIQTASESIEGTVAISAEDFPTQHGFCYFSEALGERRVADEELPYKPVPMIGFCWSLGLGGEQRKFLISPVIRPANERPSVVVPTVALGSLDINIEDSSDRVLVAALAFLRQKLLGYRRERPDRAEARRAKRENEDPTDILVVTLRKRESNPNDDSEVEERDVEWTCQWLVRGHWRKGGSYADHPKWIMPYVKGPEDKPFRAPERFFEVVR